MRKYIKINLRKKYIAIISMLIFIALFSLTKVSAYYQHNITQVETILTYEFTKLDISTTKTEYGICSGNTTIILSVNNPNSYNVEYVISLTDNNLSYTIDGVPSSSYVISNGETVNHNIIVSGIPETTSSNIEVVVNNPYSSVSRKTIIFDTSCPVCAWTSLNNSNKYLKAGASTSYMIECSDNSGIASTDLTSSSFSISNTLLASVSGITKESINNGYRYNVSLLGKTGNGNITLALNENAVKDNSENNNSEVASEEIIIDNVAPTVSYSLVEGIYNSAKTIIVTPNDTGGSGINYYHVSIYKNGAKIDSKSAENILSPTYSVTLDTDGLWTIYTYVADKAGNLVVQQPNNETSWYYQTYVIDTTVVLSYNYNYQNNDMTRWQKSPTGYDTFNISYDSETQKSTVSGKGIEAYEVIYFPINTISGKTYEVTFNYEIPIAYTPITPYSGIGYQALTNVSNSDNLSNSLATTYLPISATSGVGSLTFTATGSVTYFAFNYGMAVNDITTTVKFSNFNITTKETKQINSTYNPLITPTREGYTFDGWYTSISSGEEITNTSSVTNSTDHTIYAHWTVNDVILTYSSSNLLYGLNNSSSTTNGNMAYSINNGVVTVTGNNSDGWGITTGRVYLESGKTYTFNTTISSNWNVYQQAYLLLDGGWSSAYQMNSNNNFQFTPTATGTYWLRLDVDGTGMTQTFTNIRIEELINQTKEVGTAIGNFPIITRPGYSLIGWYTAETGGTQLTTNTITPFTATKYYARWQDNISPSVPTSNLRANNSNGALLTNGSWYNYPIWLGDFYATDTGGSGINRIEISYLCTESVDENANMNGYTYSSNIDYSLCLRAVDNAGNVSAWSEPIYIKVDVTKPTINLPANPLYIKRGSSVNILGYASASDNLSQIRSFTVNYTTVSGLGIGSYNLTYTAIDNAGNIISASVVMTVYDKLLCDGSITITGNSNALYRDPVDTSRCIYRGTNPNNYVRFNGTYSGNSSSGGTLYRIIGLEADGSIKMIHSSSIGEMAWHSSSSNLNYNTSSIRTYLNGTYYNSLNTQAKSQIQATRFYIGQMNYYNSTSYNIMQTVTAEKSTLENNASSVGLMNVYDFLLGSTNCNGSTTWKNIATKSNGQFTCDINNWLVYPTSGGAETWFITKHSDSRIRRWLAVGCTSSSCESSNEGSIQYAGATNDKQIRPVIYLKESVIIVGGTGTTSDPYILSPNKFISNESPTTCAITTTSGYEVSKVLTINPTTTTGITYSWNGINYNSSRTMTITSEGTYNAYIKDLEGRTNTCSITIVNRTEYQHQTCSSCKSCYYCTSGVKGGDMCYIGKRGYGELYNECNDLGFAWYNGECYNSVKFASYGTTCGYCGCNSWNTSDTAWYTNSCGTSNYSSCKNMTTRNTIAPQ